ncbi:MAG: ABC transporter permease [Vicinamibacterales bacterium]
MHSASSSTAAQADRPEVVNRPGASAFSELRSSTVELWSSRALLYQLAVRDVRIRYKQAAMGFAWAILMPLLIILAGIIVRSALAYVGGGDIGAGAVGVMAVKAVPWAFFVGALGFATTSLTTNATLVTKVSFPREVLPMAAVLAAAFDALVASAALVLTLPAIGVTYSAAVLWVPYLASILVALTTGTALLASCGNLFFRDVKYVVQVLLTFGIFFTPVLFEPAVFGTSGLTLMMLNPLAPILEGLRLAVVEQHNLAVPLSMPGVHGDPLVVWTPLFLAYSTVWAVALLVSGLAVFHRSEYLFAEYV